MIVEKHPMNQEAVEDVYDFYELEDIELADETIGQVKKKVGTYKRSQLVTQKESVTAQIADIDAKIASIDAQ